MMQTRKSICSIPIWIALVLGLYVLSVGPFERLRQHNSWLWRYGWIYQPVEWVGDLPAISSIYYGYLSFWTGQSPAVIQIVRHLSDD